MNLEHSETERRDQTNLRILDWSHDLPAQVEAAWTKEAKDICVQDYTREKIQLSVGFQRTNYVT